MIKEHVEVHFFLVHKTVLNRSKKLQGVALSVKSLMDVKLKSDWKQQLLNNITGLQQNWEL